MNILIFIIVIVPIIMSIISLFSIKSLPKTIDDFFTAGGNLKEESFIDTSVAYAYQIAAISLFTFWGFEYGFWTIWVPIFWGLGYFILKYFSKKGYISKFISQYEGDTIHGLLNKHYGLSWIAVLAGISSMLGLGGTAFFEAEFTSNIIINLLDRNGAIGESGATYTLLLFILFVTIAIFYIIIGGQKAIVKTDIIQLKAGFILFMCFLGGILGLGFSMGYTTSSLILFISSIIFIICLFFLFKNMSKKLFGLPKLNITFLVGVIVLILSYILGSQVSTTKNITIDNLDIFVTNYKMSNVFILGFPALISLLIANAVWQLVDVSNWERISSIRSRENFEEKLTLTLNYIGIYSPITWMLAIILGMGLKLVAYNQTDSYNVLSNVLVQLINGELFLIVISLAMLACMTLVMFSTLDSLILAISFTVQKDIFGLKNNSSGLFKFKLGTILITISLLIFYLFARTYVSEIDSILYTFYAFQIGLLPTVYYALTAKSNNKIAAVASMITGIITPIIVFYVGLSPYDWTAFITFIVTFISFFSINILTSNERYRL